jgi:radical SAM superfamily enzyme YgiQ (UPF0313 family)
MKRNKKIDCLLINPGNRSRTYQALGAEISAVEPPTWIAILAGFVKNKGYSVQILDANAECMTAEQVAQAVAYLQPVLTVVVIYGHQPSASTQVMPSASKICLAIKQTTPESCCLLVGGHVAALPERTLREELADFVCGGEGFWTIVDLLATLKGGSQEFAAVRDLYYRKEGVILRGPGAPLVTDLELHVPKLPWELFSMDLYRAHNWHCFGGFTRTPYASIYTSLGCPFRCDFCCIQAPFKAGEALLGRGGTSNSYRTWTPHWVIREVDCLVEKYGVANIKFADELFVLNPSHVGSICNLIVEHGHNLNIWAYARVDTLTDKLLEKLSGAGVNWLAFGFESASHRVRRDVNKGFRQERIHKIVEKVKTAGVSIIGNYIFGLPEDSLESMQETFDMALQLNCEFANFYCAMAYPGSKLHEAACEQEWDLPQDWNAYSQHSYESQPLPTRYLSAKGVLKFRDEAFETYFTTPSYLSMIKEKFGQRALEEIQCMLNVKIRRRILGD